nr:rna polymerase ii subunit a c-terminal domain phosphatase ssu72 [Quercus suber]
MFSALAASEVNAQKAFVLDHSEPSATFKYFIFLFISFLGEKTFRDSDLHSRDHALMKTVLVINLEVKDNHEEAAIGARLTLDLCQEIEAAESWEDSIDDIIATFEKQQRRKLLYSISFY